MAYVPGPELAIGVHVDLEQQSSKSFATLTINGEDKTVLSAVYTVLKALAEEKKNLLGCTVEKVEKGSIIIYLKFHSNAAKEHFKKSIQDGSINIILGNLLRESGVAIGELRFVYTYSDDLITDKPDENPQTRGMNLLQFLSCLCKRCLISN